MKHALLTPLLICWLAGSTIWTHPGQEPAVSGDSLYAVYLLSVVAPQPDVAHYVNAFAHLLTGTPYTAGTLDRDTVERLQPGLQETDCTIFVETVLALARCAVQGENAWESYCRQLTGLRYRNGRQDGYASRLHYFSDWIADNERRGLVQDITRSLGGLPDTLHLDFMSRHADRYPALRRNPSLTDSIAAHEQRLSGTVVYYLPAERLDSATLAGIHSGDIIAFTTGIAGLDIAHVGIALQAGGETCLIHASSTRGRVVIEEQPLNTMIAANRRFTGIRVVRPLSPLRRE